VFAGVRPAGAVACFHASSSRRAEPPPSLPRFEREGELDTERRRSSTAA
jgi:hypothetical protein